MSVTIDGVWIGEQSINHLQVATTITDLHTLPITTC
jgi:hypothetical protein